MGQSQKIACGIKTDLTQLAGEAPAKKIPINGLTSIDLSKYALRVEAVFVMDLPLGADYNNFTTAIGNEFIDFVLDPFASIPKGFNASDYNHIQLRDYPSDPTNKGKDPFPEAEFIYSDTSTTIEQFRRLVNYGLMVTGSSSSQGFYGLIIECVPFEEEQIYFGKGLNGSIRAVDGMRNILTSSMATKYIDALCSSISMPTPPEVIVVPNSYLKKYAGPETFSLCDLNETGGVSLGMCVFIINDHKLGHKINGQTSLFCNLADNASTPIIESHHAYLAELLLHFQESGRADMFRYGSGVAYTRSNGTFAESGGYFIIIMNDEIDKGTLMNTFIHELGHLLSLGDILQPSLYAPHLNLTGGHNSSFADNKEVYKNWRGFGNGKIISFDGGGGNVGHPSPANVNHKLHSCPLIYLVGTEMCPMPSANLMGYPNSQALVAASIYYEASYIGASCDETRFPTQGEVFLYEAFVSLVNEFAEESGDFRDVDTDKEAFLMFNRSRFEANLALAKNTQHFFLKSQILWGGITHRNAIFGLLPSNHVINFTIRPEDFEFRYRQLRSLFYQQKIKYDKFEFTQKEEYELKYEDQDVKNITSGSVDFFKRAPGYSDIQHEEKDSKGGNTAYSHVHDTILDTMGFEILEDVIEVINGQPRRTYHGVAKYNYVVSKAKGDTASALTAAFNIQEADAKIKSIFGGEKMVKEMAIKNAQGKEECKYVYVVYRHASDLDFGTASLTDDKGRSITIS